MAIGREDVELEEIPADDNDKVKIDSILCPCIRKESEKYGFEISRADKSQSAIKMEISVQPVPGNVVEVNGQKETPLALTYEEAKESVTVDRKIVKARQKMISQIIYSLPGRIAQEFWLLGYYFPWEPGDQKLKNIVAQNYRLLGDYFPWDPGGQSCKCIKCRGR